MLLYGFSLKINLDISFEPSAKQMISMQCHDLLSMKIKKKRKENAALIGSGMSLVTSGSGLNLSG